MEVFCNSCDWRRSSESNLAELSFIFDHGPEAGHRSGTVKYTDPRWPDPQGRTIFAEGISP